MKQSPAMRRCLPALVAAGCALLISTGHARADDTPVAVGIDWESAETCADAKTLRRELATQVQRNAIVDMDLADVVIRGTTPLEENRLSPG